MIEVGVRRLKNSLSRYLKLVQEGETIVVTDRGKAVARLIPSGVPSNIAKLMAEGRITWSGKRFTPPENSPVLKPGAGSLADYIAEDRR